MGLLDLWKKKPAPEAAPEPEAAPVAAVAVAPIVINPTNEQAVKHAAYRADAIARDIEQRRAAGETRPDHDRMVAQALSHAHGLVAAGKWTDADVKKLEARLRG